MRYFTDELWSGINSESREEREKAELQWNKNAAEYYEIFSQVEKKLPRIFLKIFEQERGFHDYELKRFVVMHGEQGYIDPVSVSMVITNGVKTWEVLYKKIKKISINYDQQPDVFNRKKREYEGFDDYGYNEFLQIDGKTFSHEILFASGAVILIHFERISIKRL